MLLLLLLLLYYSYSYSYCYYYGASVYLVISKDMMHVQRCNVMWASMKSPILMACTVQLYT